MCRYAFKGVITLVKAQGAEDRPKSKYWKSKVYHTRKLFPRKSQKHVAQPTLENMPISIPNVQ